MKEYKAQKNTVEAPITTGATEDWQLELIFKYWR